jgi:hypothetical protein
VQYAGWFNTALERDKSVFTLSAGGIGLLVTLATTKGLDSVAVVVLYTAALLSFLVSLAAIIFVFNGNKRAIEKSLSNQGADSDNVLRALDHTALTSFGIGVLFSVVIGISTGVESLIEKRTKELSESALRQETLKGITVANESQKRQIDESFAGLNRLQPTERRSFEGLQNLNPNQGQGQGQGQSQQTNPPQSSASETSKK